MTAVSSIYRLCATTPARLDVGATACTCERNVKQEGLGVDRSERGCQCLETVCPRSLHVCANPSYRVLTAPALHRILIHMIMNHAISFTASSPPCAASQRLVELLCSNVAPWSVLSFRRRIKGLMALGSIYSVRLAEMK